MKGRVVDEKGEPIEGVSVRVKGSASGTTTDGAGYFTLARINSNSVLAFSSVSIETFEVAVEGRNDLAVVKTKLKANDLEEVNVTVNTGYQEIPKERATGSFVKIDNELLNRRVGTDILDRIGGIDSGVLLIKDFTEIEVVIS